LLQFKDVSIGNHPKLSDVVYRAIKDRLVSNSDWAVQGFRLQEGRLAEELGVSRTPVREAIHRLEKDGLVEILPRKGAYVRTVSVDDVREIFDIRGALEALALRSSFPELDRGKLQQIHDSLESCETLLEQGDLESFVSIDEEFHGFLAKSSNNAILIQIIEKLDNQLHIARLKSFSVPGRVRQAFREHLRIIDVILSGDARQAERLILEHSESAKRNTVRALKSLSSAGDEVV
jgi:DNA-binding GntR family transcriptional regulator